MMFLEIFASVMLLTTYPFFVWCDRRRMRARLAPNNLFSEAPTTQSGTSHRRSLTAILRRQPVASTLCDESDIAQFLDDVARRIRLGASNVEAFCTAVQQCASMSQHWQRVAHQARINGNVPQALHEHCDWDHPALARAATALCVAHVGGSFVPAALERASRAHRDRWAYVQDLRVATSQARLSAQVLTVLPVASLVLSTFSGTGVSYFLSSPGLFFILLVGIALNYVGWRWIHHTTAAII